MAELNPKNAYLGMNMDSVILQKKPGELSYALNAITEGFSNDGQITYQNEQGNTLCVSFPEGYKVVGIRNVVEEDFIIVWLAHPDNGYSQIGRIRNCIYTADVPPNTCLKLSVDFPILKSVYRKNNCGGEVYWVDANNRFRYLDFGNLPFIEFKEGCSTSISKEVDCNKLNVFPNFFIPQIELVSVGTEGTTKAGTVQFAVQYSNAISEAYTSFYSITNPLPIYTPNIISPDFNYDVNSSVDVKITNIDQTGLFDYFNLAVIKTINNTTTAELVGTFQITSGEMNISYSGQSSAIKLSTNDVFQKFEVYNKVADLTVAQDVLIPSQLTANERISYQQIANSIHLQWQTYRVKGDKAYSNPILAANKRGYMGDEVYAFEFVPLLTNGKQCDGFIISSRAPISSDLDIIQNNDTDNIPLPRWKVYNTAYVTGTSPNYDGSSTYEGEWQYGEFAYWESERLIPCNEMYGDLQNTPIRHHKFPDNLVANHFDNKGYIYIKGIKIDVQQVADAIKNSSLTQEQKDNIAGFKIVRGNRANNKSVKAKGIVRNVGKYEQEETTYYFPNYPYNDVSPDPFISSVQTTNDTGASNKLDAFSTEDSKKRMVFNSPDTSFFSPSLGTKIKIESLLSGSSTGHFVPVQKHAQYKFLTFGAYAISLLAGVGVGFAAGITGWKIFGLVDGGSIFDGPAALSSFQTFIDIIDKVSPRKNFAYQYNSIGNYNDTHPVQNTGDKIRTLEIATYLSPGMQGVGDDNVVNNFQRESSVYLKYTLPIPFPYINDDSRIINSYNGCSTTTSTAPISSYYTSIISPSYTQYGDLYSYETIDTGYQKIFSTDDVIYSPEMVFGGDIFINKFAFKTKLPFFIDNRIGQPDDSDIDYREFNNVAYPTYWFSTDTGNGSGDLPPFFSNLFGSLFSIFGIKQNNFDCIPGGIKFYQKGKIYLFAYGIPYFYVESEVNTDLRQAYNSSEGDYFPHVSSSIPDFWFQEINTSINYDNTYTYNKTFSKQNKENNFTHLSPDFSPSLCTSIYPFRAIFSEPRVDTTNPSLRNNWLIYKPASYFDFPQSNGALISLDGIENKQVLARFENKTLLYNALLTAPTSAGSVYLGQTLFSQQVPPIDYADTDLGYVGTQNKFLLKTEFGDLTIDSKRGQVFLLQGQKATDLSIGITKFLTEFLDFQIKKYFPSVNIDNHFNGIGMHGVYDSKYNRAIITKLDYKPLSSQIKFSNNKFYVGDEKVELTDTNYFCNYSFTISYSFDTQSWISFHSYLPNYYVGNNNYFFSGLNSQPALWRHSTSITKFNSFYNSTHPYILEYPFAYKYNDEIVQNIKDYSKVMQYTEYEEFIETDDIYFNKCILYNNQQSSGLLLLSPKPKNNLSLYNSYPKYNTDSKEILYTKSNNFYQLSTFWSTTISSKQPIWKKECSSLSIQKSLNQENCNYGKRSYNKAPLMAKDLKIRLILDDRDDVLIRSQFLTAPTIESKK